MFFPIPKRGSKAPTAAAAAAGAASAADPQEYVAFSARRAKIKHFLSAASRQLIGASAHFKDAYVLGKVVHKEKLVATEADHRRLCLKPGSLYFSVTVSALPFD